MRRYLAFSLVLFFIVPVLGHAQTRPMPPAVTATQKVRPMPPAARMVVPSGKSEMQPMQVLGNYDMGDPTAEEQYLLELINRARANPPAEGNRFDTITDEQILYEFQHTPPPTQSQVKQEFQQYAAVPPLAFNKILIQIARDHDNDMKQNAYQGHTGTDGKSPFDRMNAAGYTGWNRAGENVFDFGSDMWDVNASFECDFGNYPGMGHRLNLINFDGNIYTEVGLGVIHGQNGQYGPIFTTEDFGTRSTVYITGVVYNDKNKNGMYDIGEGISGATITVSPAGSYTAVSSTSGGYAIPYSGSGTVKVTATSATGLGGSVQKSIDFDGSKNVKVDFTPDVVTQVSLEQPSNDSVLNVASFNFTWDAVQGATKYRIQIDTSSKFTTPPAKMFLNDSSSTTTSKNVVGLKDGITYYWRVQARVAAGWAPYSASQTFSVVLPPNAVALVSPADNANFPTSGIIKFVWHQGSPRVMNYHFVLASDSKMTNIITEDSALNDVTDTTEVVDASTLEDGKRYYWTVSAQNDAGWGAAVGSGLQPRSITIGTQAGVNENAYGFDVHVSPNPTATRANITFSLSSEESVTLRIFNSLGQDVATENLGRLGAGVHAWTWDAMNLPAGSYYYELRAGDRLDGGRIQIVR